MPTFGERQERCVWDNAAVETFYATLKNEMYYRYVSATKARAWFAVAEFIEVFYNSSIGYRTPAQALNDYRSAALAAWPTEGINRETVRNP